MATVPNKKEDTLKQFICVYLRNMLLCGPSSTDEQNFSRCKDIITRSPQGLDSDNSLSCTYSINPLTPTYQPPYYFCHVLRVQAMLPLTCWIVLKIINDVFIWYLGFCSTEEDQIHNGANPHVAYSILSIPFLLMPWWLLFTRVSACMVLTK